ncbi:alkaline phosphatase family protein [Mycolicibacterium fluoranthenivorans]|uniref:Type I phosphodiesterase / nucleotide pyrophosphatase n=1 Tax=Mycolicibacterium fluoranthenivorans TaxID=258505 RepID=A0A1G4WQX3_9MYCO|nr:alkaline phosphatase family protein [Mycolicibacterium fluoranthenivorans]SCX27739.1 Type I phosphodiesterase / nucleotide pyrophosphatase [Mycolicibacterium fluoranthenivorans]
MKTVKQVCLGVAMAGVIAGAGSAAATAVAYADPADSGASSTSGDSPGSDSGHGDSHSDKGATASSAPKADTDATTGATPGEDADSPAESTPKAGTPTRGDVGTPKKSRTPGEKVRKATESVSGTAVGSTTSTRKKVTLAVPATVAADPDPAPAVTPQSSAEPIAAKAVEPAVKTAPTLTVSTPVAPAPDPEPLPLPLPAVPATPAGLSSATAATTTSRSRAMSTSTGDAVGQITAAPTQHVLVIGIDGTSLGRLLGNDDNGNNESFLDLLDTSTTGASSIQGHTTISNPSWTTMLTGVWDTKSGVINNIFNPQVYNVWHTVFDRLEAWNRGTVTKTIADWDVITDISGAGTYGADQSILIPRVAGDTNWSQTDTAVANETVRTILGVDQGYEDVPNFLFSYLVQVDEAGHAHGGASTQYTDALTRTDENLRLILTAVADREAATGEDWTVLVVTDHGHQPQLGFGHGFQTPTETTTFVVADGPDFGDGKVNLQYSIADITPTILSLFGAPLSSDFDGVPLTAHGPGAIPDNGVEAALKDAIADIGYPDLGTQVRLSVRTIFASIPYFLNQFTDQVVAQLQAVADQGIFLISTIASIAVLPVQFVADVLFQTTNVLGNLIGLLTGAGLIGPTDPMPEPFLVPDNAILV